MGRGPTVKRDFYGLYYREKSGDYEFQTIFPPLWAQRDMPDDRASVFGLYYNRRGKDHDADVLFPFFWRLRDMKTTTTVVLPFVHREREATKDQPARHDNWLLPLAFEGASSDGSGYFHAPPLLTFTQHNAKGGLNIAAAGPCTASGRAAPPSGRIPGGAPPTPWTSACPPSTSTARARPTSTRSSPRSSTYFAHRYDEVGDKSTNLWGPVLLQHSPDKEVVDVLPLFYRSWGKNESHTTLFPFFHYGYKGNSSLLVTPLFLTAKGEDYNVTASWVYAKYRGRTELDMYTPLYWQYRDPDIGLDRKMFFPFYYESTSPRSKDQVVFPFYARFQRTGISDQIWVTPLFRHVGEVTGWETDLFPILFFGRKNETTHSVIAPIFWDIASAHSRTTIAAPFFFRFADDKSVTQVALNTFYREKKVAGGTDWEFHFFPVFSYGQSPVGHWWNVLYGLAGYTREGTMTKVRAFYSPIQNSASSGAGKILRKNVVRKGGGPRHSPTDADRIADREGRVAGRRDNSHAAIPVDRPRRARLRGGARHPPARLPERRRRRSVHARARVRGALRRLQRRRGVHRVALLPVRDAHLPGQPLPGTGELSAGPVRGGHPPAQRPGRHELRRRADVRRF